MVQESTSLRRRGTSEAIESLNIEVERSGCLALDLYPFNEKSHREEDIIRHGKNRMHHVFTSGESI